uniref:Uncharacterized protein n=1 Tax=Picea sitchensis TaxID=3332 RepID=B8LP40_PICSI|nr:unknown [Picea sitchensis]
MLFWVAVAEQCSLSGYREIPVHTKANKVFSSVSTNSWTLFSAASFISSLLRRISEAKLSDRRRNRLRTGQALIGVLCW